MWVNFGGIAMKDIDIFYGHLIYVLYGHLVYLLFLWCVLQFWFIATRKSGNPAFVDVLNGMLQLLQSARISLRSIFKLLLLCLFEVWSSDEVCMNYQGVRTSKTEI
jgi:hypothetical protein